MGSYGDTRSMETVLRGTNVEQVGFAILPPKFRLTAIFGLG
jgi:hypothetical protein